MPLSEPSESAQTVRTRRAVWGVLIAVFVIVAVAGVRTLVRSHHPQSGGSSPLAHTSGELPILGSVPDFALTERSGASIARADLTGNVWIADFIFTRCGNVCPLLSARMARVQTRLRAAGDGKTRLVSFTVDPDNDTPAVLRDYADRFHADATQWWFLTGERAALDQLINHGFQLSVAQRTGPPGADPNDLITHSDRFALVDGAFQIRGYYRGTDDEAIEQLLRDVAALR